MASLDLQRLWKLHLVDAGIAEIRNRAANLDVGNSIQMEIEALQNTDPGGYRVLHAEQTDLELQQQTIEERLKKVDRELYGGKLVSPREIETFEKEIASLKARHSEMDERLFELMELVPTAKQVADASAEKVKELQQRLASRRKEALKEKSVLESEFARLTQERPEIAKLVPSTLLARYEDIRKKHSGIGMAKIDLRNKACTACGMLLPERTIQGAKDDRTMTCEACSRILYYSEGLV